MVIYDLVIVVILKCISGSAESETTGKRSGGHLEEGTTVKKLKDSVSPVGGALDGTVNEYRLNLEDEQQDASIC